MSTMCDRSRHRPGSAEGPNEVDLGLCADLLREARLSVRRLLRRLAHKPAAFSSDALRTLAAEHGALLSACGTVCKNLEPGYLLAYQYQQQVQVQEAHRDSLLERFDRNLTFVGSDTRPRHWSHFAWIEDNPDWPMALSRDSGHLILASGIQGCGKTLLSTVLGEGTLMAGGPLVSEEMLRAAYVFFHIEENDRLPQLLDGLKPNPTPRDLQVLATRLGVGPLGFRRLRLAVPERLLADLMPRLVPYIDLGLEVVPLKVRLSQLGQPGLEAALGADDGARFVLRMLEDAQDQGKHLQIRRMHEFIDRAEDLNAALRRAAHVRLGWLEGIASPPDGPGLWQLIEPGWATVFYLGGPHMGHGRVAPLLVGLLSGLLMPSEEHGAFQRVIAVDEVNLLHPERDKVAWQAFIRAARLVRHRGATLMLMGQDLLCVPDELFGLAGLVAMFKQRNPKVWDHTRERVGALRDWSYRDVEGLKVAQALFAATVTTDPRWQQGTRIGTVRPPRSMHGGMTRMVV